MNRTRKIAAAGLGVAVALVLGAMVLMNPTLQTQTPVSTTPPANGGANNGGGSTAGTGNSTTSGCNLTAGNQTGENGDHDGGSSTTCDTSSVDHDAMGDRMSSEHRSVAADEHMHLGLGEEAIALAELGISWTAASAHGALSVGTSLTGLLSGFVGSGLF